MTTNQLPSVFEVGLPTIDYYRVRCPAAAHRYIARVRDQSGIALGPYGPEILSYEFARAVLRDRRFVMPEGNGLAAQGVTSGALWDRVSGSLVGLDGERHRRLRSVVCRAFTPKSAERMRAACTEAVGALVDRRSAAGHCEVVQDIARPYPTPIICELLGVRSADWEMLSGWVRKISKAFGPSAATHQASILEAWTSFDAYMEELLARRCRVLSDDLLSELIRAESDGSRLARRDLLGLVAILFVAGTDTTHNQLAAAVQSLCAHSDQWELLGRRPDLAPRVVEEAIRYSPVAFSVIRVAVEDVVIADVVVPAGTHVVVNTASANRDPMAYPDPDRFDVTRAGHPPILTFGGGAHHCLGAHLARIELAEALAVMARRMPFPRLVGPTPWRRLIGITGPRTVPLEFEPGH